MRVSLGPELDDLTGKIIGAAMSVYRSLGHGFLESVYKNAMVEQLSTIGLPVAKERSYPVHFRDKKVGQYHADLVVADKVVVELKAISGLAQAHRAQVLNYLRASGLPVGLLFNFGTPRLEFRRIVNTVFPIDEEEGR
jgi:GxxExxY protein